MSFVQTGEAAAQMTAMETNGENSSRKFSEIRRIFMRKEVQAVELSGICDGIRLKMYFALCVQFDRSQLEAKVENLGKKFSVFLTPQNT